MPNVPHALPVGTAVELWRDGVFQQDAVVFRHDRNGTYRLLHEASQTYVTAYPEELKLPGTGWAYEVSRPDGTVFFVDRLELSKKLENSGMSVRLIDWSSRAVMA